MKKTTQTIIVLLTLAILTSVVFVLQSKLGVKQAEIVQAQGLQGVQGAELLALPV